MLSSIIGNGRTFCITLFVLCVASPASAANKSYDWTPFFKSWENACEFEPQEVLFTSMIPDADTLSSGSIAVPKEYAFAVDSELKTIFYDDGGEISSKSNANYFDASFDIVGKYYDIPIVKIGFIGGVGNGIYSPYFVLDKNIVDVRKILRKKNIDITYESSDFHDSDMYGNSDIGIEVYANSENPDRTNIICDFSN